MNLPEKLFSYERFETDWQRLPVQGALNCIELQWAAEHFKTSPPFDWTQRERSLKYSAAIFRVTGGQTIKMLAYPV